MTKMKLIHNKLSLDDLEAFEREHKIEFPELYRKFLLENNGGNVAPNVFYISSEAGESALNVFYGIGDMYNNLEKKFDFFDEILEVGFIPIASDSGGNQICLGVNAQFIGKVYFWNHEQESENPADMTNMFF